MLVSVRFLIFFSNFLIYTMETRYAQAIKSKQDKMDKLLEEKAVKLEEQSKLAIEFNDYLTKNVFNIYL